MASPSTSATPSLANSNVANRNIVNSNLANSNLTNSHLANSNLANSNLTNSHLANSNLANSHAPSINSNLADSNLANSKLANSTLANSDPANGNLAHSNLPSGNSGLTNSHLPNANNDVALDSAAEATPKSLIQYSLSGILEPRLFFNIELNGLKLRGLLDDGSVYSYLGRGLSEKLHGRMRPNAATVRVADGNPVEIQGILDVTLGIDGDTQTLPFRVADSLQYECILGIDFKRLFKLKIDYENDSWWTSKGLRHQFYPFGSDPHCFSALASIGGLARASAEEQQRLAKLLDELIPPTPSSLGVTTLMSHRIDVQGHEPIRQRMRKYAPKMLQAAQAEVDRMLLEGIIEPSESPWCSCPVIVPKANGKYRFCIDYRKVNEVTKKIAYPLRNMDDILDKLRAARYISKLDLSQAYHQIPLERDSKEITAFAVAGRGLFHFNRLPYGLTNAPAVFQKGMDQLIKPQWEPHVFVYLDDVIIVTTTFDEHVEWLQKVLTALKQVNLQINREKSEFCCSEVKYLGYVVNEEGLRTDEEKIRPILEYPPPTNLKQLRRFLGMIGWYARFIANLAKIKVPLTNLMKKDVRWQWLEEQEKAFQRLKLALTQAPVLARPDLALPFCLQTDASDYAIAGVLTQVISGEEHPICYVSRTLSKAERNYTVTEKECLAVLWAVERLRGYLQGEQFTVITDHHSLLWLNNLRDPAGRLARWNTTLQAYDIKFVHRKGALNKVPDALSRAMEDSQSLAAIAPANTNDPWYQRKLHAVQKSPAKYPEFKVENGLLYAHKPNPLVDPLMPDLDAWKLVLPLADRDKALAEAHSTPQAGHLGVEKTYARLATYYYWPGYFYDTSCFVRACQQCEAHKSSQLPPAGLMHERNIEGPWVVVAADIMGPKPPSKKGFRYLIVFEDLFTKYVELKALRKADAKNVLQAFDELIINRWGCPQVLLTDNGTEFANKLVAERLSEYGIKQSTIPPYHAQANPVERVNRNLKTMISSFLSDDHREWDAHLNEFSFALNTMTHSTTKVSPAFMNFGRNPVPVKLLRKHLENPLPLHRQDSEKWATRVSRLPALHDLVRRHQDAATSRQARYYNRNRRDVSFQPGDLVRRRNHVLSSAEERYAAKHAPKFVGPAKVVEVLSPVVYLVEDLDTGRRTKVFVNDLRKHVPPRGQAIATASPVSVSDEQQLQRSHELQTNRPGDGGESSPPRRGVSGRGRGRPRKERGPVSASTEPASQSSGAPRRGRGRPKRAC